MDWSAFSPWTALSGGALIGLAALVLLFGLGRIAGISGIIGGLLQRPDENSFWRLAFILGLGLGAYLMAQAQGGFEPHPNQLRLIGAGLLVGYGTLLGGGCTSGHGICGLARLSPRSMVAVLLFMVSAMATATLAPYVIGS